MLTGTAQAAPIVDDRGRRVEFDAPPKRIVSLLPSLTETVCALGACDNLVGVDRFSNWPEPVRSLPKLGGQEDTSIERIVRLDPDLVLVSSAARVIDRLDGLGLRVVALDAETLAESRQVIDAVASLLGREAEAKRHHDEIDTRLRQILAHRPKHWDGARVYFEISDAPFAAGASSFIGELLRELHLVNIVPVELGPFPKLNPEFVVRARPELVMATSRQIGLMAQRPGWSVIPAIKAGQTCGFEPEQFDVLSRPGPRLVDAMSALVTCLEQLPARSLRR